MMRPVLLLCVALVGCTRTGDSTLARDRYNDGVEALAQGDWQTAQTELLAARDGAGPDPELRYRAAFDLGMAHVAQADSLEVAEPKQALEALETAASWFRDAVRLRPDDEDARVNLELILRRSRIIADRVSKDERGLEAVLDVLIEDQRGVRDGIRTLMTRVELEGAGADPRAFQREFETIEVRERTLLSQASTVIDLAADERATLEDQPEDQRTPQSQGRLAQLTLLESHMAVARQGLADARRLLRRLNGDRAHLRGDAALRALKRAREQLADPPTILRQIAQDEQLLLSHTTALRTLAGGDFRRDRDAQVPPPWLTAEHLAERQSDALERTTEMSARLDAVAQAPAPDPAQPVPPEQQRAMEQLGEAAPFVARARAAMQQAHTAILAGDLPGAIEHETSALAQLAHALERFGNLRALIELAYAQQQQLVTLLTPPESDTKSDATPSLTTEERLAEVTAGVDRNRDRLARMKVLLEEELQGVEAQAQQLAAQAQQQGGAIPEEQTQALEGQRQKYARAEELRAAIDRELEAVGASLVRRTPAGPLEHATSGLEHLEELRRLFFSLVEHLKQIHADAGESRDQTASAHQLDDAGRQEKLGPLADRQREHADLGEALASAIEAQADQAIAAAQDEQGKEAADKLQRAAPEVRAAATALRGAGGLLAEARDHAATMSIDLEPTLAGQQTALEHLENALRILEPPKPQDDKDDQDDQDQQEQQSQDQVSQQEAQRRLQQIREAEEERRRERRERQPGGQAPVEKDW